MIYILLIYEFFKIGLFSIGGGLASLPFLYELSEKTGWFSLYDISNLVAVSEATPTPVPAAEETPTPVPEETPAPEVRHRCRRL